MKKFTIILISAIVLLSVSAAAIFAMTFAESSPQDEKAPSQENIQAVKPATFETLSSLISTEKDGFVLSTFNQKEIFADLSRDNLREIFAAFDIVLEKNETIELKDTLYHRSLFDNEEIKYTLTNDVNLFHIYVGEENGVEKVLNHDGRMTVSTDQNPDVLKYAMLTSVYMELFPDNWTYGYTQDDVGYLNRMWFSEVYVIPDYEEYGFESAFEAFQSYTGRTEKQFEFRVGITIRPHSTKLNKEINEFRKDSNDPYLLDLFFFWQDKSEKLSEAFAMPKKTEVSK